MRPAERGFLLLTGHLGNPERKPLTASQLRQLAQRARGCDPLPEDRELEERDLMALGYGPEMAKRIADLLAEEELLEHYLQKGRKRGCVPITRISEDYPLVLRRRLGVDSPGCLWARGDISLLAQPAVALVGSRELREENRRFAAEAGRQAALQGYVLISGNARGADRTAQESCLAAGGKVICVVPDALWKQPTRENVLYLSEDGYDEAFSAQRALSRNRCIHGLGLMTFVAQVGLGKGGTWDGTMKNLHARWSGVYAFRDGSEGMTQLEQMGACLIEMEELESFYDLPEPERNLFDR
ncbi:MAG: DNA-processing protein DprA [Oscillospiraceae bacterium]|nr:DNA-processing protein DprA [Oscillospiraceae bacterium]